MWEDPAHYSQVVLRYMRMERLIWIQATAYLHSVLMFSDCGCDVSSFCLVSFPEWCKKMIISLMFITATEVKLRQWGFKDENQKWNIFMQLKIWIEIAKKEEAQGKHTGSRSQLWAGGVLFSGVANTCRHFFFTTCEI